MLDQGRQAAQHEQPEDAAARLARAVGLLALQQVLAAAGVGVEHEERRLLALECLQHAEQDDVLEHVRVVAGMEGVSVVHPPRI